jgi:ribonuclease P protein component
MRDFKHLFQKGSTQGSRYLGMRFVKKEKQDFTRFAFVVSTKTAKLAVDRNRAKRQLREAVRELLPKIKPHFDVSLTIKASFLPLSYEQKQEQVLYLLKKAGLIARIS